MLKGTCAKVETLQDGTVKVSVYVAKEYIQDVFALAYQEVSLSLATEMEPQTVESESIVLDRVLQGIDALKDAVLGLTGRPESENQPVSEIESQEDFEKPESAPGFGSLILSGNGLSDCCGEPVVVDGSDEGTMHYQCSECGEPCGVREGD